MKHTSLILGFLKMALWALVMHAGYISPSATTPGWILLLEVKFLFLLKNRGVLMDFVETNHEGRASHII